MNETMDIYSAPNTTVKYTGTGGYDSQKEYANKFLEVGGVYTVERLDVGRSSSEVFLKEVRDKGFNSVHFENVGEFLTVKSEVYNNYHRYKPK